MRKIPPHICAIMLTLIYMIVTISLMVYIIFLWHVHVSETLLLAFVVCWFAFCWSSSSWQTFFSIWKQEIRLPTIAEEAPLQRSIDKVQSACLEKKGRAVLKIDLRIEENDGCNAFASGKSKLVLSKGIIAYLTEAELCGVIAHELGHLYYRDSVIASAFITAHNLHRGWPFILSLLKKTFLKKRFLPWSVSIAALSWWLIKGFPLFALLETLLYFVVTIYIDRLFFWVWIANQRLIEYGRDHFAHDLGYGKELATALLKLSAPGQERVSWFYILGVTHPVVYHRVRRMEILNAASATTV